MKSCAGCGGGRLSCGMRWWRFWRSGGLAFEAAYVEELGGEAVRIEAEGDGAGATVEAMEAGRRVIVQGVLAVGRWYGRADILRRVDGEAAGSRLGAWHYEVVDTKLAGVTAGRTVLQLCLYSELVAEVQGRRPEAFWVVTPGEGGVGFVEERYRLAEYDAYVRWVRRCLEEAVPRELEAKTGDGGDVSGSGRALRRVPSLAGVRGAQAGG